MSLCRQTFVAVALAACTLLVGSAGQAAAGPGRDKGRSADYLGPKAPEASWVRSRPKRWSVLWAVGDGAIAGPAASSVVGMIATHRVDRLLYLGDVYNTGTAAEFESNYRPLFGRFDPIAAPTIGNHEWANRAKGYHPYWANARGRPAPEQYSFVASGWQLLSLNSNAPADPAQLAWLDGALSGSRRVGSCRIAFMHHPRFSASGVHGDVAAVEPLWSRLAGRVPIVLAGHDHDMQRLVPIAGSTLYISGAGGRGLYPVNEGDPRLAFSDEVHYGALRVKLRPRLAELSFFSAENQLLDQSRVPCRQRRHR